jgi:hypothetical protein
MKRMWKTGTTGNEGNREQGAGNKGTRETGNREQGTREQGIGNRE